MSDYFETSTTRWSAASPAPQATNGAAPPPSPASPHLTDEQLAAWAADELMERERVAARQHLAGCAYCQNALSETQHIRALLRAAGYEAAQQAQQAQPMAGAAVVDRVLTQLQVNGTPPPYTMRGSPDGVPPRQRRDRWRRLAAVAAVVLLIVSSALIFSRISARGQTNRPTANATPAITPTPAVPLVGNWAEVVPPQATIQDVAVVSQDDIWAAGFTGTSNGIETLLMHYNGTDGTGWQVSPDTFPGAQLYSISMVSATDGWAVGSQNGAPFILHYTGGHWQDATASLDTNALTDHKIILTHVRMATAISGWALGLGDQQPQPTNQVLQYLKVGGTYRWEPVESLQGAVFNALSVVSDHEAWMVGASGQKTIIVRVTCAYLNNDPTATVTNWSTNSWGVGDGSLSSVSISSPADGWAGGVDSQGQGALFHWNGQEWHRYDALTAQSQRYVGPIQGIVMTGPSTGWVYAELTDTTGSMLFSLANGVWTDAQAPSELRILIAAATSPTALFVISGQAADDGANPAPALYDRQHVAATPTP